MQPGAPLVEPEWGDNIMASRDIVLGDPDAAFAAADGRSAASSARPDHRHRDRAARCVASYEPYEDILTFWDSTQNPHPLRTTSPARWDSDTSIRVIQPHVGGGFGLKNPDLSGGTARRVPRQDAAPPGQVDRGAQRELPDRGACARHALLLRGRVQRRRHGDGHPPARDRRCRRADCALRLGMSFVTWYCLPCVYKIPNSETHLRSVVTNKCPWNAYRGYGKDAASFLMDRIMDHVAKVTGLDRTTVRFRNFIQPDEFPFPQVSGAMIDSGDYAAALEQVLGMIDYEGFPQLQEEARAEGRFLGLGSARS